MKNTPKLRFPEFSGEWGKKPLNEIITLSSGGTPSRNKSTYWNGNIPWITTGEIDFNLIVKSTETISEEGLKNSSAKIFPKNTILVAMYGQGKTRGKSAILGIEAATNQACAAILPTYKIDNNFIYQYLSGNYEDLRSMCNEGSQKNLSLGILGQVKIGIPVLEEQQKISGFFSIIDKKIEKQQEKVEDLEKYKKGIMQKIFSQEIRFKDENGEEYPKWKHIKLNEAVERVVRRNKGIISKLPLTISAQYGLVDQETFFNKTVASSNLESYFLLYKGEFAYNKSYSAGYPWGAIKRLDNYDMGVLSSLYICFTPLKGINSDFLVHYFETNCWHKEVSMIAVEGARNHGLLNISVSDFFETLHYIPSYEEQVRIADFLTKLEKKFNKEKEKLDQLNQWKKGLLQQMFV